MKRIISMLLLVGVPAAAAMGAADITVNKTVSNALPVAGEPVEFTIDVQNLGDALASAVVVADALPAEMDIPAGMAAFTSVGSYDPGSGEWLIGDMAAGTDAVMMIPAVVVEPAPPACIVNVASSLFSDAPDDDNDVARAAVRQPGVERCVDLDIRFGILASSPNPFPSCGSMQRYQGDVELINYGPDIARDIVVSIDQSPVIGPNLRFDDADCSNATAATCQVTEIGPGETITIDVTSDLYQNEVAVTQTLTIGATTNDVDYDLSNNNPSSTGVAPGFSSCEPIDLGIPGVAIGPSCFVATAAYGSPLDPHLDSLRDFRDQFLVTNAPGRAFVRFYYRHSPPIAVYIADRDGLRALVRVLLAPIVMAIEFPLPALGLVVFIGLGLHERRRRCSGASRRLRVSS